MKMTNKEIKKYAKNLYYQFKKNNNDYSHLKLMMELKGMSKNPVKYLEKEIKRILTEPRLPKMEIYKNDN